MSCACAFANAKSAHAASNAVFDLATTYNLEDSYIFVALFISLIAGILATRLATELYK